MLASGVRRVKRVMGRVAAARRRYDASFVAIAGRVAWLRACGIGLDEALGKGLIDPRTPARAATQLARDADLARVLRAFNRPPTDAIDDKSLFYAACRGRGLPVPELLAVVTPPLAVAADGRTLRGSDAWRRFLLEELPDAFVVKPARGLQGDRVEIFERRGGSFAARGRRYTADELHRRLCVEAAYGRAIVQRRLTNHATLAELSGTPALQCTRMVTVVKRDGAVELPYACQKLISGGNETDNFGAGTSGNLVANVDLTSGALGTAFSAGQGGIGIASRDVHPATGRRVAGTHLPEWDRACALVRRAALHALPLRAIGWDVALTPEGPVLVEGNTLWFCLPAHGFWHRREELERLRAWL